MEIPRGRGPQRIPERKCPEEEDAQRKRMHGGRGCPEGVDAWRTWTPGGKTPGRYVWNAAEEWIRIRPQMEEQMPDDDSLVPAPGHSGEAGSIGFRRSVRYSEDGDGV